MGRPLLDLSPKSTGFPQPSLASQKIMIASIAPQFHDILFGLFVAINGLPLSKT
ncbi:hypothetical protein [Pseudophaeobacter sp.]|uniref:hypothetical protein n=1 Tax=Pseudophaeobacter sp. TaxID=1971739 RepID=UPI003297FAF1